ncbi:MAG TPA: sugar phosphate isomerase/epimerase [Vicinamibacterales bacterium]
MPALPPYQILPSTTSHKAETLIPTLEVFARLGFTDLDLNLNHIVERGTAAADVIAAIAANGQRVWIASGGWCDFFDEQPQIQRTFESVDRQVALTRAFGVDRLRLFFGRMPIERWSDRTRGAAIDNIRRVGAQYPDITFVFENHDGASSNPDVCGTILEEIGLPNVRLTFDAVNFEHRGVKTMDALRRLHPLIGHVHLKGYDGEHFCEFGQGTVDLGPALEALITGGYRGPFTVEYEGAGDRTLRLYTSVQRARDTIRRLVEVLRF